MRNLPLLALTLALLPAAPALADPAGEWIFSGRDSARRDYQGRLHVTKTASGFEVERSAWIVGAATPKPAKVYRSIETKLEGDTLAVSFRRVGTGIVSALDPALGGSGVTITARYTFSRSAGVDRLREYAKPSSDSKGWRWATARGQRAPAALILERERAFRDLYGDKLEHYEASGVVFAKGRLHVVFDNSQRVASMALSLKRSSSKLEKVADGKPEGLEGLTYDPASERFWAITEAAKRKGEWRGRLWSLDEDYKRRDDRWLEPKLAGDGKGFEGLAHVARGGRDYLLALYEGNHGADGEKGRERGNGRIALFERRKNSTPLRETIALPAKAAFEDYSGISVRGERVAVVSQQESALWVGRLKPDAWEFVDEGEVYAFPRRGTRLRYGALEGVAWIDDERLACVSDQSLGGASLGESVHVFRLPK